MTVFLIGMQVLDKHQINCSSNDRCSLTWPLKRYISGIRFISNLPHKKEIEKIKIKLASEEMKKLFR